MKGREHLQETCFGYIPSTISPPLKTDLLEFSRGFLAEQPSLHEEGISFKMSSLFCGCKYEYNSFKRR